MSKRQKLSNLFPKDAHDRIIPESLKRTAFSAISKWRVSEYFFGSNLTIKLEIDNDDVDIIMDYDGGDDLPSDLKYMLGETINKDFVLESVNTDKIVSINLYGKVIGESVSSDYKSLNRHYFIVDDVFINSYWLSFNDIKDFCDDFELHHSPDLGVYHFDLKKLVTQYRSHGKNRLLTTLTDQLMDKLVDFDKQQGIQSLSQFGENKGCYFPAHGVQCRSQPQLFDQSKNRIQFKIRTQDLNKLYKNKSFK
jgi:hypothetical protein